MKYKQINFVYFLFIIFVIENNLYTLISLLL